MVKKYLKAAIIGIRRGGQRTFLAVLGISMSIYLVMSLVAVGRGVQVQIEDQVSSIGDNVIGISSVAPNSNSVVNGFSVPTLTLDDLAVAESQPTVTAAAPMRNLVGDISYKNNTTTPTFFVATTYKYPEARDNVTLKSGRFFTKQDQEASTPRVVIGTATQEALFGSEPPLGKIITYNNRKLKVVGVMNKTSNSTDSVANQNFDNALYAPLNIIEETAQKDVYSLIFAKVSKTDAVEETAKIIRNKMSEYRDKGSFDVVTQTSRINTSQTILTLLAAFIGIIGLITIVISGIGVMNVMVLAVAERIKEIGMRKTVGATSANIFIQFLTESIILSAMGGLIGLGITYLTTLVVARVTPIQPELTLDLGLSGLALAAITGLVFGISPALNASRREPIEALQTGRS